MTKGWMIRTLTMAGALMICALPQAQAQATGSIHGHVQNPAGIAISGDVKLTTDTPPTDATKYKYDFAVDENGNYKGTGIAPGTYVAVFFKDGKTVDYVNGLKVVANQDAAADFDMTRAEFTANMTPEEKQALEDYKAKAAATMAENSKITNANTLLQQARDDMKATHAKCPSTPPQADTVLCPPSASDYDAAATLMLQATGAKPDEGILWFTLGDAQSGQKKFDDAVASYNKAIALNDASKKPKADLDAAAYNNLGQADANSGHITEAAAAYEAAAKAEPTQAGMYYNNEAAIFFNKGQNGDGTAFAAALAAADKAIAADPTRPDPYFVRGNVLIQSATVDKTGKVVAPPGCADAYQKYLELAPNGAHAADATAVLTSLGETIHSTYKAGKK